MTTVELSVNKSSVYDEVAKTTAYSGAKMTDDAGAYERVFTTDADQTMLERFWDESKVAAAEQMKRYVDDESDTGSVYTLTLGLSASYDEALTASMQKEFFSYFVMNITAKWFAFTNKKEASDYGEAAKALLTGIHKKAVFKKRPTRPTYS